MLDLFRHVKRMGTGSDGLEKAAPVRIRRLTTISMSLPESVFEERRWCTIKSFRGCVYALNLMIAAVAGFHSTRERWVVACPAVCLELASFLLLLWSTGVQLGAPTTLPTQFALHFALHVPMAAVGFFGAYGLDFIGASDRMMRLVVLQSVLLLVFLSMGGRKVYAVTNALLYIPIVTRWSGHYQVGHSVGVALYSCKLLVVLFTEYWRDEVVIFLSCNSCVLAYAISGQVASSSGADACGRSPIVCSGSLMLLFIVGYAWFLMARRLRYLPAGLQHAKFIKLSYLRKMHKCGHHIVRLQDLPAEAFGDAHKSLWLIIASHRWLDRYTCDVATPEHPSGLRLSTMLEKLEGHFSPQGFGQGNGLHDRYRRLRASLGAGGDVLIFFDFMCIPQVGKDDKGEPIPRTYMEDLIFKQILPSMPTLYSTFDVCVFPAVIEGAVPYEESGWCFCERVVASLGGRLEFFSPEYNLIPSDSDRIGAVKSEAVAECLAQLRTKHFLNDSDRHLVRTLVRDYKLKRSFHDAIVRGDTDRLRACLESLQGRRKFVMLNSALDCQLNTPLHLAVTMRSAEMTELMLHHGALRSSRNLRGDTPTQFFMLPMVNRAAMLCRMAPRRDDIFVESQEFFPDQDTSP